MKRTKEQKGITLVALIITIVVLLILAVVAITSIQNTGILEHANNAATQYNQKQEQENTFLNEYENFLNNYAGNDETTEWKAYSIGQEVTVGGETFYVIENSNETQEKVLLLAKENIDTTNLVQSASSNGVLFSATNYWADDVTSSPYDLVETGVPDSTHYAAYAAYQYGVKLGGTGRLMYYSEADTLISSYGNMIMGTDTTNGYLYYWLGSADSTDIVCTVDGSSGLGGDSCDDGGRYGVRPVVEISKSKIS